VRVTVINVAAAEKTQPSRAARVGIGLALSAALDEFVREQAPRALYPGFGAGQADALAGGDCPLRHAVEIPQQGLTISVRQALREGLDARFERPPRGGFPGGEMQRLVERYRVLVRPEMVDQQIARGAQQPGAYLRRFRQRRRVICAGAGRPPGSDPLPASGR
jgi:hypothetical protein